MDLRHADSWMISDGASSTVDSVPNNFVRSIPSKLSAAGITSWAKNLKIPLSDDSTSGNPGKSTLARFANGFGLLSSQKSSQGYDESAGTSTSSRHGFIETFAKGLVDTSKNAVKVVQVKARHAVSQNKRRYQDAGFDLDMTYITENIIAMGFPAGDLSSGFFGYVEGFYRNHMEEVINFFETHHKDKYKVYNLCSERLYDASLFEGKVASFPFDDHNSPPLQLVTLFCQSAYSWLKEDIENVVVVHCKAGMARTGLMISSLLLYLNFFPTAEESIEYYNQKRCTDGKGLVLPSQIRYVKYFERVLTYFNGENQPKRRCMLRGFRFHRCPYWIKPSITISDHNGIIFSTKKHPTTKDLEPENYWFNAPKKGVVVFALPGEPGLTELAGDFKVHFHDRQGDFYFWLNTSMMENRKILSASDIDGFDKRKLPSPEFQVEVVLSDINTAKETASHPLPPRAAIVDSFSASQAQNNDNVNTVRDDDVFSDGEADESIYFKSRQASLSASDCGKNYSSQPGRIVQEANPASARNNGTQQAEGGSGRAQSLQSSVENETHMEEGAAMKSAESKFKAMAADTSVFTFGSDDDDDEYCESERANCL